MERCKGEEDNKVPQATSHLIKECPRKSVWGPTSWDTRNKTQEENPEAVQQQEDEPLAAVPPHKEKEVQEEGFVQPKERKDVAANFEGSVTRSREKASSEETKDTSAEEQEPLSKKWRKSNKSIREQEATRVKTAGK